MLRNALELRKRARDIKIGEKRQKYLEGDIGTALLSSRLTLVAEYYLKTAFEAFFADLKRQREADAPQQSIDFSSTTSDESLMHRC